jgi:hypothetical protein
MASNFIELEEKRKELREINQFGSAISNSDHTRLGVEPMLMMRHDYID